MSCSVLELGHKALTLRLTIPSPKGHNVVLLGGQVGVVQLNHAIAHIKVPPQVFDERWSQVGKRDAGNCQFIVETNFQAQGVFPFSVAVAAFSMPVSGQRRSVCWAVEIMSASLTIFRIGRSWRLKSLTHSFTVLHFVPLADNSSSFVAKELTVRMHVRSAKHQLPAVINPRSSDWSDAESG